MHTFGFVQQVLFFFFLYHINAVELLEMHEESADWLPFSNHKLLPKYSGIWLPCHEKFWKGG